MFYYSLVPWPTVYVRACPEKSAIRQLNGRSYVPIVLSAVIARSFLVLLWDLQKKTRKDLGI